MVARHDGLESFSRSRSPVVQYAGLIATWTLLGAASAVLSGCQDSTGQRDLPEQGAVPHGLYTGHAQVAGKSPLVYALLANDGTAIIHVGDFAWKDSLAPVAPAAATLSVQFTGEVSFAEGRFHGSGNLVGESCANADAGFFCGQAAAADIDLYVEGPREDLRGTIVLHDQVAQETWSLDLQRWLSCCVTYSTSSGYSGPTGIFVETLADVAGAGQAIISIGGTGELFLQADATGCVANGQLFRQDRLQPANGVFGVEVDISNCTGSYEYLNHDYTGFALVTFDYWGYGDSWLLMLLSSAGDAGGHFAALTLTSDQTAY